MVETIFNLWKLTQTTFAKMIFNVVSVHASCLVVLSYELLMKFTMPFRLTKYSGPVKQYLPHEKFLETTFLPLVP